MNISEAAGTLLAVRGVGISFGGVRAVRDINLDVRDGEHLAIIGQNGAGKSTFLNICSGHLKPASGRVILGGRDITGLSSRAITRMGIGRTFQHPQVFARHTLVDNLRFALAARQRFWRPWIALDNRAHDDRLRTLLNLFGLDVVRERRVFETSEGTRKLLDIAMAVALEPRLLLMDEPTSGVSAEEKFDIMDTLVHALDERGVAAVFVEHDMDIVQRYAHRVSVWMEGRVFATGSPESILHDRRVLESVL